MVLPGRPGTHTRSKQRTEEGKQGKMCSAETRKKLSDQEDRTRHNRGNVRHLVPMTAAGKQRGHLRVVTMGKSLLRFITCL